GLFVFDACEVCDLAVIEIVRVESTTRRGIAPLSGQLKESLDLATQWGYASSRRGFDPNDFDYRKIADLAGIEYKEPVKTKRFENQGESADLFLDDELDNDTIVSFTISFEPNQNEFSADRYGAEFERALKGASTFGNARIVVRGHSDPTLTLRHLVQTGEAKGVIRKTGTKENRKYFYNGRPMNVNDIPALIKLIETGAFSGGDKDPMITLQAAKNLSKQRADRVRDALAAFAKSKGVNFDISQIAPVGAGIADPVIPKPTTLAEAKENMRVEFRIVRVDAETVAPDAFDF
ncbi:MAG: hypothetical protein AAF497_20435, partial [Planctomycetota bacterium]